MTDKKQYTIGIPIALKDELEEAFKKHPSYKYATFNKFCTMMLQEWLEKAK
jgi:hypothetical protein